MNRLVAFRWELARFGPIGLAFGLAGLLLGVVAAPLDPQAGLFVHAVLALAAALLLGTLAAGVDGRPTADFFLSRNVSRLGLFMATLGATLVSLLAVLVVPWPLTWHATAPSLAGATFGIAGVTAGVGRLTGRSLIAMPVALVFVGGAALLGGEMRPAQTGGYELFCVVCGTLGFAGLGVGFLRIGRANSSGWRRRLPIFAAVGLCAFGWVLVEQAAMSVEEGVQRYVSERTYHQSRLRGFRPSQVESALLAVDCKTPAQEARRLNGLMELESDAVPKILTHRWTASARTNAQIAEVDVRAMGNWPVGQLPMQAKEALFEWSRRKAKAGVGSVGRIRSLMYATGKLDTQRAASVWMPAIVDRLQHSRDVVELFAWPLRRRGRRSLSEVYAAHLPAALGEAALKVLTEAPPVHHAKPPARTATNRETALVRAGSEALWRLTTGKSTDQSLWRKSAGGPGRQGSVDEQTLAILELDLARFQAGLATIKKSTNEDLRETQATTAEARAAFATLGIVPEEYNAALKSVRTHGYYKSAADQRWKAERSAETRERRRLKSPLIRAAVALAVATDTPGIVPLMARRPELWADSVLSSMTLKRMGGPRWREAVLGWRLGLAFKTAVIGNAAWRWANRHADKEILEMQGVYPRHRSAPSRAWFQ